MAKRKITKTDVKNAKKAYNKLSPTFKALIIIIVIALIVGAGAYYYFCVYKKDKDEGLAEGQLSVHFLELGNAHSGDCVYIKAGETDILIDGGSDYNSSETIQNYVNKYVNDGILEYAIITHCDLDHIACWAGSASYESLFDAYTVKTIIDNPKTTKNTKAYNNYIAKRDTEVESGATHYTALQCYNNEDGAKREYTISDGITLEILYNYYYDHSTTKENNNSVCFMINQGSNHYLFTGDLEEKGEEYLVKYNTLPKVTLFKAGHHGSGTSNTDALLSVIEPKYIAVTCVAGSVEYSTNISNTFPYQLVVDTIANYTENVFVTSCMDMQSTGELDDNGNEIYENTGEVKSLNGTIIFTCNDNEISFTGTNNSTKLKDSEWFKKYRTMPEKWAV